jgi:hypothetical protein
VSEQRLRLHVPGIAILRDWTPGSAQRASIFFIGDDKRTTLSAITVIVARSPVHSAISSHRCSRDSVLKARSSQCDRSSTFGLLTLSGLSAIDLARCYLFYRSYLQFFYPDYSVIRASCWRMLQLGCHEMAGNRRETLRQVYPSFNSTPLPSIESRESSCFSLENCSREERGASERALLSKLSSSVL